jgi:hypothetical protein
MILLYFPPYKWLILWFVLYLLHESHTLCKNCDWEKGRKQTFSTLIFTDFATGYWGGPCMWPFRISCIFLTLILFTGLKQRLSAMLTERDLNFPIPKRKSATSTLKYGHWPYITRRFKTPTFRLGKAISVKSHGGPYGCETSRFPQFLYNQLTDGSKVVSLMCWLPFTPRKNPGTPFCLRLSWPQGHSMGERIRSTEKSSDPNRNWTRHIPACSIAPQPKS